MKNKMNITSVPVIYYHSIKYKTKKNWVHPHITMILDHFYKHLNFLKMLQIKTFFMDDLYYHIRGKKKLPLNSLIINFDDGYLDNFIFAFPLLKKYKMKATIWVNPDFVDNNNLRIRPTLEDYWGGKISLNELNEYDGFLNWEEMKIMERSGLVDIQSHTMTHTKYPVSDKIIDFVNPDTKIDWLYWNLFPSDKPFFLTKPNYKIPLGYPVYESQKGIIAVKYEENGNLTKQIIKYVQEKEEKDFFSNENWRNELFNLSEKLKSKNDISYIKETDEEYTYRVKHELSESKNIIEKNLEKKVNHVCWPFGGWNEKTIELANKCGYLTNTAKGEKNIFKKDKSSRIDRIALDNPKYQNKLFIPYAFYKLFEYKFL